MCYLKENLMKNTLIIFENSLLNLSKKEAKDLLEDLCFNLAYKQITHNSHYTQKILNSLLVEFLNILKKLDLLDDENTTKVIKALVKASIQDAQNTLYDYMNEIEILNKQVENQKNLIKNQISNHFFEFENILQEHLDNQICSSLNDAILFDIEMLGILKETAESAFLTTLEKAEDIELTSNEIAKNLVYNAICEAHFEKERILKISSIVLNTAFEIANESMAYAKDLCLGVIKGTRDGIALAMEKFKSSLNYAAFEEDINLKSKELIGIEDDFITLLKKEIKKQNNPAKEIVENLLEYELDNLFAKFKRLASESREQLLLVLNDIKKNPKINDFNRLTQSKLYRLKQEIYELENIANEKYKDINSQKAKKLGIRLWEKAKNLIKK
ncbi:hypothetical protein H2268_06440 [Campylobacter sp. RM12910]|nr:hypothetical protein [Campylobacter sp. RM12910]MBZ7941095.1 hypothetical protein [Campylobacter sp. W0047]MBZ7951348.1 hypothetical protein [Campylobacter sp. W0046]MBZ7961711.1 hypothetical protein [Campylobacter sp. RM9930]MBZ7969205.1 hypothetical protein [Campylobacter sp. RM9759]MBZ7970734.1 hypothetical protein [Campylobacter sp. RM3125]MBZ7972164.1 hypothetical protein [Campylobacter sp. RM3124]MBZ7973528.1 hypothetical protein [Campylobacter sp. RM9753]